MSLAKSLTLDLTCLGMSFMYARKRIGQELSPAGRQRRLRFYLNLFHKLQLPAFDCPTDKKDFFRKCSKLQTWSL